MRQAITHFDLSRIPEGITASRYPSDLGQYIPTFSLLWVAMVHDYWMHRDDPEFVRGFLPGVRSVVGWFERRVDESRPARAASRGGPTSTGRPSGRWASRPGGRDGHSTVITLQFVYALERAAELEDALGLPARPARDRSSPKSLRDAVRAKAWDAARGLFRDAPGTTLYSQQTNIMAVLVDAVPAAEQRALMERVLTDATLTQATYYFSFYLFEALAQGRPRRPLRRAARAVAGDAGDGPHHDPETPEPTRSDSHAWSAHPNYGLLATVLGVRPDAPGFRSVRIAPAPRPAAAGRRPDPASARRHRSPSTAA